MIVDADEHQIFLHLQQMKYWATGHMACTHVPDIELLACSTLLASSLYIRGCLGLQVEAQCHVRVYGGPGSSLHQICQCFMGWCRQQNTCYLREDMICAASLCMHAGNMPGLGTAPPSCASCNGTELHSS